MFAPLLAVAIAMNSQSSDFTFSGGDGFELAGTVLMPEHATGKVPAVVLLPGSGPTDRDGNSIALPGIKIDLLKQLAESLSAKGIASLRFDKRAVRHYSAHWPKDIAGFNDFFGWDKFVGDAKGAVKFLKSQPGVDPNRVGLIGHSEGGLITLQVAHDMPTELKAIGLLSTGGRPMDQIIHDQIQHQVSVLPKEKGEALLAASDGASAALKAGRAIPADLPDELKGLYNPYAAKLMTAYFNLDPVELARAYPGPVLIVNGGDDIQISAEKDLPVLKKVFTDRKNGYVQAEVYGKASHNLKSTVGGNKSKFDGPVILHLLEVIDDFFVKNL